MLVCSRWLTASVRLLYRGVGTPSGALFRVHGDSDDICTGVQRTGCKRDHFSVVSGFRVTLGRYDRARN